LRIMNFFKKLQDLPESKRKIIFWSIIVSLGAGLLIWYVKNFQKRLEGFKVEEFKEELNLPSFGEGLKGLQGLEMPKIEDLEELKKEAEQ
jgi:hypothetical protein